MINKKRITARISFVFITIGLLLRAHVFFMNKSLWLDEAYVALGISQQTLFEIFKLTPFAQDLALPPVGFLFIEKGLILLLGNNELVLRFFPFLCGGLSLFLFPIISKPFLDKRKRLLATALFATNVFLIRYASELKPYSSDVLCSLILIYFFFEMEKKETGNFKGFLLGLFSFATIFFSYISAFLMIPYFMMSLFFSLFQKNISQLKKTFIFFIPWVTGFIWQYFFILKKMIRNPALLQGAIDHGYYPEKVNFSVETISWIFKSIIAVMVNPGNMIVPFIAFFLFLLGFVSFYKRDQRMAIFFLGPLLMCVFLSWNQKYPFGKRFLLFYLPLLYILIVEGIFFIGSRLGKRQKTSVLILSLIVLFGPIKDAGKTFVCPNASEQSRLMVKTLFRYYRRGDSVFMNTSSKFAFGYYHGYFQQGKAPLLVGEFPFGQEEEKGKIYFDEKYYLFDSKGFFINEATEESSRELIRRSRSWFLDNQRTWVLLTQVNERSLKKIQRVLDAEGSLIQSWEKGNSYLYLYDLKKKSEGSQYGY